MKKVYIEVVVPDDLFERFGKPYVAALDYAKHNGRFVELDEIPRPEGSDSGNAVIEGIKAELNNSGNWKLYDSMEDVEMWSRRTRWPITGIKRLYAAQSLTSESGKVGVSKMEHTTLAPTSTQRDAE